MILQALCTYYDRLAADPSAHVAMPGYSNENVAGEIVINGAGDLVAVNSLMKEQNKKMVPKTMEVPHPPKRSGSKPEAAFLFERPSFIFGLDGKTDEARRYRFEASQQRHQDVLSSCTDPAAKAVLSFYSKRIFGRMDYDGIDTSAFKEGKQFFVFRLSGDKEYIHDKAPIRAAWEKYLESRTDGEQMIQDLVTGQTQPLAVIHDGIAGFGQDKPCVVGFNQPAFCSFGKYGMQGANAPVGKISAFKYATALNRLSTDPRHYIRLGGDKVLFWAERNITAAEDLISLLLGTRQMAEDGTAIKDDQVQSDRIKTLLSTAEHGGTAAPLADSNSRFFILGLGNNKTRIVIRFFYDTTYGQLLENINRHYHDLHIIGMKYDYPSPYALLIETAVRHETENIMPNLESELMRSIISGIPYPQSLYQAIIRRIRAEMASQANAVSAIRVGIIKACINRNNKKEVIKVALDRNENDTAYLLGRLFAIIEQAQWLALGDVNASVADKYMNSALATPQMVFPTLMAMNQKHLAKASAEKGGSVTYLSKQIGSIMDMLQVRQTANGKYVFPSSLDMNEQGKFIVGYYQQKQSFFAKEATNVNDESEVK